MEDPVHLQPQSLQKIPLIGTDPQVQQEELHPSLSPPVNRPRPHEPRDRVPSPRPREARSRSPRQVEQEPLASTCNSSGPGQARNQAWLKHAVNLGESYYWWYRILLSKIYRLCTHHLEGVNRHHRLAPAKDCLDVWETAHKERLSRVWVAGLTCVQRDAVYSVLYTLAEEVFEIIARRKEGETCQEAVGTVVGDTPSFEGYVQVWQLD